MKNKIIHYASRFLNSGDVQFLIYIPIAVSFLIVMNYGELSRQDWIPRSDSVVQFTEFLYAVSAFQNNEMPLWNSYWYGGQPFYLLLNHGLLLNPIMWIWIIFGTLVGITQGQIYVCYHLTEIVFFSLGGLFFVREITKNNIAALLGFIILLFSGDPGYWISQIYSFTVIFYIPWILFFAIRYFKKQSICNALVLAVFTAINVNVYYPIYLIAFVFTLLVFFSVFYFRILPTIDYRKLSGHILIALPVVFFLALPTYFAYTEINSDFYQISRYNSEEQVNSKDVPLAVTTSVPLESILRLMLVPRAGFHGSVPLIGIAAFLFMVSGMLARNRLNLTWTFMLLAMYFNIAGRRTPFFHIWYATIPFYNLIRSFPFFSGFIAFSAMVLSCMGIDNLLRKLSLLSHHKFKLSNWTKEIFMAIFFAGLVFYMPADQRAVSMMAGVVLFGGLLLAVIYSGDNRIASLFKHILLAVFIVVGVFNLSVIKKEFSSSPDVFSYNSNFYFSFERPDYYISYDPNTTKSIPFDNLGKKTDAPWYFDDWGSDNTLLVDRQYYHRSKTMGFDGMMRKKLHFLKYYTVYDKALNYNFFIDKSILVLGDETNVGNKNAGLELDRVEDIEEREEILPAALSLYKKTANRIVFDITVNEDVFMLYTDRYHKGFKATIDGKEVPVLKGMDIFKAVELPAGKHLVEFVFEPFYGYVLIVYLAVAVGFYLLMLVLGMVKIYKSVVRSYRCNFLSP